MSLNSLIRSFNHLSVPKKLAASIAAIVGVAALISIPVMSLRPPRQPSVFNEDAYYQHQISEQNPAGKQTISSQTQTSLDTTTTPNPLTVPNESATIPGVNSPSTRTATGLDTTAIPPGGMRENLQSSSNNSAYLGRINNPDNKPTTSSYTPSSSFSTNPYNLSNPGSSYLKTPYSLPIPNSDSSSSNPYSLQPSPGNSYTNPDNQSNSSSYNSSNTTTNSYTNPDNQPNLSSYNSPSTTSNPSNSATTPSTTPIIPSEPVIAPNTLNGPSGNSNTPGSTSSSTSGG